MFWRSFHQNFDCVSNDNSGGGEDYQGEEDALSCWPCPPSTAHSDGTDGVGHLVALTEHLDDDRGSKDPNGLKKISQHVNERSSDIDVFPHLLSGRNVQVGVAVAVSTPVTVSVWQLTEAVKTPSQYDVEDNSRPGLHHHGIVVYLVVARVNPLYGHV